MYAESGKFSDSDFVASDTKEWLWITAASFKEIQGKILPITKYFSYRARFESFERLKQTIKKYPELAA